MWVEIAKGSAAVGLIVVMFRSLQLRIDKKTDQLNCDTHVLAFKELLNKGDEKFDRIIEKLDSQSDMVSRIDERTKKHNGGV